jgi:hypothetical protein
MATRLLERRRSLLLGASIAAVATVGCNAASAPSELGSTQVSVSVDTTSGSGLLVELKERRAAWVAHGIDDYRMQLQISCFCGGDITRPVLVEVRRGVVSKVWDLETGRTPENIARYPTITALFDAAIAERSGGGHVSVSYDRTIGFPVRLEIGTLANDAGTMYTLGGFRPLRD